MPRRLLWFASVSLALAGALSFAGTAAGFQEPNGLPGPIPPNSCEECHLGWTPSGYVTYGGDCESCHADVDKVYQWFQAEGFEFYRPSGPHSGYGAVSNKCQVCHSVHDAPAAGAKLLPSPTIVGTCFTCHDGTAGWGVYGAIVARDPLATPSGHRVAATSVVPGGDAITGGDATVTFGGPGGFLICTDCHSPHGSDLVDPFIGDRVRLRQSAPLYSSAKLLRRSPTGASSPVSEYGSDWCLSCHAGRGSGGAVHNHPVESSAYTTASPVFTYGNVARLASHDPTGITEWGAMGGLPTRGGSHDGWGEVQDGAGNRGFLMPYPRTEGAGGQAGHYPLCMQCHEDSRNVGELTGDGSVGDAATAAVARADGVFWDGSAWVVSPTDNPRFQNFPHEAENRRMLVEVDDDLCLNCHPVGALP